MPDKDPARDPADRAPAAGLALCCYSTYVSGPGDAPAPRPAYGTKRPDPPAPDAFPDALVADAACPPVWHAGYVRGRLA